MKIEMGNDMRKILAVNLAILGAIWVGLIVALVLATGCDGTAPPLVIKQPSQAPSKCEAVRSAALAHIRRCDGMVDLVCIPPALLQPCSHAVHVDETAYDRCLAYLTDMRPCSYAAFGCDWEGIIEFTPVKSADMSTDTPVEKCESMALRAGERGKRVAAKVQDPVVCVNPERLLPCSQATGVSDEWDACMISLVTDGAGKNSCPQRGLVTFEEPSEI